jgi:hypothetical protein
MVDTLFTTFASEKYSLTASTVDDFKYFIITALVFKTSSEDK